MPEDRIPHDVLARITGDTALASAVPHLRPDVLHAIVVQRGLRDCGDLLALATPRQIAEVFDLDLWQAASAGADEQFDAVRFGEWLEVLVEAGPEIAAGRLAVMDLSLVVAGLSPHVTAWDPAVFSPAVEVTGADPEEDAGRARGMHASIGGYLVVARRDDSWEAIVAALASLASHHGPIFHQVMHAVRRLSDSGHEIDGLDNLFADAEQLRLDLSLGREERRERAGFLPPQQARAFLASARRKSLSGPPQPDTVFTAYLRAQGESEIEGVAAATTDASAGEWRDGDAPGSVSSGSVSGSVSPGDMAAIASVMEVLRGAGLVADTSRALLPAARDDAPRYAALERYLTETADAADEAWIARQQALAFLANALAAGCSLQGRPFTPREASDAVAATCSLGLECWPPSWDDPSRHDLVTVFRVGWAVLHGDVSMVAAAQLMDALAQIRSTDRDLQFGLAVLRRELRKQHAAGTPWRVRDRLEVLATLDLATWAALAALFDEYPVMLSNVAPVDGRPALTVTTSEFQLIANAGHIAAVEAFLLKLPELLVS